MTKTYKDYNDYNKAQNASSKVSKAIESGVLTPRINCCICGDTPEPIRTPYRGKIRVTRRIVAHHWNGYDNPLDVWWVCTTCNGRMPGDEFHNGSKTLDEVKELFTEKYGIKTA